MSALSKTAALKEAQRLVGNIRECRGSYYFSGPYSRTDLSGPSTEYQDNSYPKALYRRAARVAEIALFLMGEHERFDDTDPVEIVLHIHGPMSAKAIVDKVLAK